MRRFGFALAIMVLAATALFAQKTSPLIVETLEPTPTVVKTAEPFKVAYRVRFLDLRSHGKEIVVLLDQMQPQSLPMSPFEVVSLDLQKRKVGDEHVWNFVYTLRIVHPRKGGYKIPKIKFYWVMQDAGSDSKNANGRKVEEFETREIHVTYATTVTKSPYLDIRDTVDFGNFRSHVYLSRIGALVLLLPFLIWLVMLLRRILRKPRSENLSSNSGEKEAEGAPRSYKDFKNGIRELKKCEAEFRAAKERGDQPVDIEERVYGLTKTLLLLELPDASSSYTSSEIRTYVETLKEGRRKKILQELASRLWQYELDLESGAYVMPADLGQEIKWLSSARWKLMLRRWFR